ncbi:ribose pyranase [Thermosipho sp. 1063]|uniref:D-ribose pyranase n=1 Tax=unclassified Thermosipho (in: thermotogales) TaxID=2676525 RepID=UPI000949261F|nr:MULTISPECIES: D-ribose pyranase [unclassified Thermosipho (in: thermotogales)]ANQ53561.1 ribose pyranase [Thermosipho sp. 1070]APT72009.1 ribose pyranase [Thermosipho sp. 1063]OOC44390.1 ribose pyranase [Thermosipho sp. 1074]
MKKTGIFNSEIARIIASLGHKDMIAIVDMGFPIPRNVEKIDLVLDYGKPTFEEVLDVVLKELKVEKIIIAEESSKSLEEVCRQKLSFAHIEKVTHDELKNISSKVVAVIRTGDVTPYNNAILVSGVIF